MKNKLELKKVAISSAITYGLLKLPQQKIDPYTRTFIGILTGFGIALHEGNTFKSIGFGVMIGGAMQIFDSTKGGKLSFNNGTKPVYTLDEENGISVLEPGEIPKHFIDGFTFKGLNGVFKLADGVYAGIDAKNSVKYPFGFGKLININRKAGLMSKHWAEEETDKRWLELYQKSV